MKKHLTSLIALTAAALVLFPLTTPAFIVAPYSPDASTLHLWHFDETGVPLADATGATPLNGLGNGATAGNASFTGFGSAVSTFDGGPNNVAATDRDAYVSALPLVNGGGDNSGLAYADPITGAFTFEAILRIDFDPAVNYGTVANGGNGRGTQMQLITGEDESNPGRIWQFRLAPVGTVSGNANVQLEFINVHQASGVQSVLFDVPSGADPDAIVSNGWFHVAVTYDGVESGFDNLKVYWTKLDPARSEARLIGSSSLQFDLSSAPTDFAIGQTGRNAPNGNFVGLIDEVRISSVARPAGGMMFALPQVQILAEPESRLIAVGQAATFSVLASGEPPLSYQWRKDGQPISGATLNTLTFDPAQSTDGATYDVIVTNNISSATSQPAVLTVRTPLNLDWLGIGSQWDTQEFNVVWADLDHGTNTFYRQGDHVRFDDTGMFSPYIYLDGPLWPSSVVVDSSGDYNFSTFTTGGIINNSSLTKAGSGTLVIDTDNTFTGPTVVQAGILRVGAGGARGSIGNGPLTNNGTIIFDRSSGITFADTVVSTGDLINTNTGTVRLLGTNQLAPTVDIIVERGGFAFGSDALGSVTNIVVNPYGGGAGSTIALLDGAVVPANVHTSISSSNFTDGVSTFDWRASIVNESGTSVWHGPLTLSGNNTIFAYANGDSFLVDGPITGPDFAYQFAMRGGRTGTLHSSVVLPLGALAKTDGSVWTVLSTGVTNNYLYTLVVGGTLRNGNDNALYTNAFLRLGNGAYDLNGYNQIVSGISNETSGARRIINNSTNSDSRLTIATSQDWVFEGVIVDGTGTGIVHNVSLTLMGGSLTLSNAANTYSGDTTVASGTLALVGPAAIPNSSPIDIAAGATLDLTGLDAGGYTLGAAQSLMGSGDFNVSGNLTNSGTIELDLNKASGTVTGDSIRNLGHIEYGGTLKLNLAGDPLAISDSFKLFYAASYGGEFANITPASPAAGLAWDASTLATDGTIRIQESSVATNPTNITAIVTGGGTTLELSWPATHTGWTLQAQTNSLSTGIGNTWFPVPGSSSTNQVIIPIDPANGAVFYRLMY